MCMYVYMSVISITISKIAILVAIVINKNDHKNIQK